MVATETETETGAKTRKRQGVYIQTHDALREALEREATAQNISVATLVARRLSAEFGVPMPPARAPRQKYESEDAKKEAMVQRRHEKAALIKMLLEKYAAEQEAAAA